MRKLFLKVSGKSSVEEKNEVKVRKGERQVVEPVDTAEGGALGARRRWRLAKNMVLVAFKVVLMVLFMAIMVLFALIMTTIVALMALIMTIMFVLHY